MVEKLFIIINCVLALLLCMDELNNGYIAQSDIHRNISLTYHKAQERQTWLGQTLSPFSWLLR